MTDQPLTSCIKHVNHFSAEYLREILQYDPVSGVFTWKIGGRGGVRAGAIAGKIRPARPGGGPTRAIGINGKVYQAHRLAWIYMTGEWPRLGVDHINTDSLDNKWNNLRLATTQQNGANRGLPQNNTSGFKGVHWNESNKAWKAQIKHNGVRIHLGYFTDPELAHAAYCAKARELFGEFARVS